MLKSLFDALPLAKPLEKATPPAKGYYKKVRGQDIWVPRENKNAVTH